MDGNTVFKSNTLQDSDSQSKGIYYFLFDGNNINVCARSDIISDMIAVEKRMTLNFVLPYEPKSNVNQNVNQKVMRYFLYDDNSNTAIPVTISDILGYWKHDDLDLCPQECAKVKSKQGNQKEIQYIPFDSNINILLVFHHFQVICSRNMNSRYFQPLEQAKVKLKNAKQKPM